MGTDQALGGWSRAGTRRSLRRAGWEAPERETLQAGAGAPGDLLFLYPDDLGCPVCTPGTPSAAEGATFQADRQSTA